MGDGVAKVIGLKGIQAGEAVVFLPGRDLRPIRWFSSKLRKIIYLSKNKNILRFLITKWSINP
jgi:hypothetical protein